MSAALEVEDIHTYYGDSYVLQGVSLAVEAGTVAAVLGRNGVGKTTLVRSIVAFSPPRRGRIRYAGQDLTGVPAHRIAQLGVGLVPQGRRIFPTLTVREHLQIASRSRSEESRSRSEESRSGGGGWTIRRAFELFPRLGERADNRAATLSGGERQMLAVARALMGNPDLLLMDEPTEGLSPAIVDQLKTLILELARARMTILLVEQYVDFAIAVAERAYVMDKGRIVYAGESRALAADERVKREYLGV